MNFIGFYLFLISNFLLTACVPTKSSKINIDKEEILPNAVNINLDNRTAIKLPQILDEISGQTFLPNNDTILYCIQDEKGIIYGFNINSKKIVQELVFGPDGDYEAITTDGKFFYVLESSGVIYSVSVSNPSKVQVYKNLVDHRSEYESLGIDTENKNLILICKNCKEDNSKQTSGYIFNYDNNGNLVNQSSLKLENDLGTELIPKRFRPSDIVKHKGTNQWYIISSIDKLLLLTDANFKPVEAVSFSRKSYEQPEGLAFNSNGTLFISSERGDEKSAMLYVIN